MNAPNRTPIRTERLIIAGFDPGMAESVCLNSQDEDNRTFLPDEVFETADDARKAITALISFYERKDSPLVYPVLLKNGTHIGHIQAVPIDSGWEVGYHIAGPHTKNGYASEALKAFLPVMTEYLRTDHLYGICRADNTASRQVLEKCGFVQMPEGTASGQTGEYPYIRYIYMKQAGTHLSG